jgi:hypothetical protein
MRSPHLLAVLLVPGLLSAQATSAAPAALAGTVRDTLDRPVRLVIVEVDGASLTAVTDDSGRFHLDGLLAGKSGFTMKKLGYSPVSFETNLEAGRTLVVNIRMKQLQTLNPVSITAPRSERLEKYGFYGRLDQHIGAFISPEKLDSLSNLPAVSMMFMQSNVKGVRRVCPPRAGNTCDIQLLQYPRVCRWLFIDGIPVEGVIDELVTPSEIYAVEVYERAPLVPSRFQAKLPQSGNTKNLLIPLSGCGAIAIWTKSHTAP